MKKKKMQELERVWKKAPQITRNLGCLTCEERLKELGFPSGGAGGENILIYKRLFYSRLLLFTFRGQRQKVSNLWQGSSGLDTGNNI